MKGINRVTSFNHTAGSRILFVAALALLWTCPAFGQVSLEYTGNELIVRNAGFAAQRAVRTTGKTRGGWAVEDEVGNSYEAACNQTCTQNSDGSWNCTGFDSSDGVDRDIVDGYQAALDYLVANYGAVVDHDPVADLDVVSFPGAEDPYALLADVLLNDYLDGRLLVEYFKSLEVNTIGVTGGKYEANKPHGRQLAFPDDPYFTSQWNLFSTNLFLAQLMPLSSDRTDPVKIALLDSGINESDQAHPGLDGVGGIQHVWTAPATGFSDQHGLAVTTLLADQGHDGSGGLGLTGGLNVTCGSYQTAFSRHPVEIVSHSVGAWGPMSNFVIGALHRAVKEDGADIILMNFRMAYSPLVEEAIQEAIDAGVIVVAAAGNYHPAHQTKPVGFPARIDGVVSVGSAHRGQRISNFSAKGADVLAPGEEIVLGVPGDGWVYGEGTSFAAPHVAAAAALVKLVRPGTSSTEFEELVQAAPSSGTSFWNWRRSSSGDEPFLDAVALLKQATREGYEHGGFEFDWDDLDECELGKVGQSLAAAEVPQEAELHGNYPNPFNPETRITFTAPASGDATFEVFDMLGRRVYVQDLVVTDGLNSVQFSGVDMKSGNYIYRLAGEEWKLSGRMLLLK